MYQRRSYSTTPRRSFTRSSSRSVDQKQDKQITKLTKVVRQLDTDTGFETVTQSVATQVALTTPQILLLNALTKGDNKDNRQGNDAYMQSITLRISVWLTGSAYVQNTPVRCILVRDKVSAGQTILLTGLLGSGNPNTFNNYNHDTRDWNKHYKVYWDQTYTLDGAQAYQRDIVVTKRLGYRADYARGNAGTVADIDTGALYLIMITNAGTTIVNYMYQAALTFNR